MLRDKLKGFAKTGFFHIFGSSVVNKIIAFMSVVILVRILSKAEYGIFTYAWNIYSIVLLFNGFGMDQGVLQLCSEHSDDPDLSRAICSYGTRCGMGSDAILALMLLGIGMFAPLKMEGANHLLVLLCMLPAVQLLYNLIVMRLRSQKRNREFSLLTVFNTAMLFICTAGGAMAFRQMGMVLGYYIAYTASILMGFSRLGIRLYSRDAQLERENRKAIWSVAIVSMCNCGLSQMLYLLDVFVLGIMDPRETMLASYKVATIIPTALAFVPQSLVMYLYPYFAEHRNDGQWCMDQYKKVVLGLGTVNMLISGSLVFLAPLVVRLLFGVQYLDGVPVFRMLALNYFFSGTFRTLSGNLLVTQRKLQFNLLVAVISGSVNVVADFLLIRCWGDMGAALATVLVTVVSGAMSTIYLIRVFKEKKDLSAGRCA